MAASITNEEKLQLILIIAQLPVTQRDFILGYMTSLNPDLAIAAVGALIQTGIE